MRLFDHIRVSQILIMQKYVDVVNLLIMISTGRIERDFNFFLIF